MLAMLAIVQFLTNVISSDVSAVVQNRQRFLYTGSTQKFSLQYELLYVHANQMIGKQLFTKRAAEGFFACLSFHMLPKIFKQL
jgi:hypothetical protein